MASFHGNGEVVDRLIAARAMVDAADKVRTTHYGGSGEDAPPARASLFSPFCTRDSA
jgi:hypothetical protein